MKQVLVLTVLLFAGVFTACNSGSTALPKSNYSKLDNCTRGAAPSSIVASASENVSNAVSTANPEFPNLSLCTFNAIYTDNFPTAYADNPKLAKGTAPYLFYSYGNLAQAYNELFVDQSAYSAPFNSGLSFSDQREIAAFLANINQETNGASPPSFTSSGSFAASGAGSLGAPYGLTTITEGTCATAGCPNYGTKQGFCQSTDGTARLSACNGVPTTPDGTDYCSLAVKFCSDTNYPPNIPENQFFGRGSKQLTHAYNYIFYGSRINPSDPLALANQPSLIQDTGVYGWIVGLAYWAIPFQEPSGSVKPSMHDGFFNPTTGSISAEFNAQTGFGKTINIINGGIECGASQQYIRNTTLNRITSYIELLLRINPDIPINRLEVTQKDGSVHVYSLADLQANIETQNPLNTGYDPTGANASQLIKKYSVNGVAQQSNYAAYEPDWTMKWGGNGRFNSLPILQEYHFASDTPDQAGVTNVYNNGQTNLTKMMLFYDSNPAGITEERLDCAGIENYEGN